MNVTRTVALANGTRTILDADYELSGNKWQYSHGYVRRQVEHRVHGERVIRREYLHRLIAGAVEGEVVDHINGNTLDNRKCNLRRVNKSINALNSRKCRSGSGYRNVTFSKQFQKYHGTFKVDGRAIHCGFFGTAKEAFDAVQVRKKEVLTWL